MCECVRGFDAVNGGHTLAACVLTECCIELENGHFPCIHQLHWHYALILC